MNTTTLVVLIWPLAALILAASYGAAIGANRRAQLDDYLAIRRDEWREGLAR